MRDAMWAGIVQAASAACASVAPCASIPRARSSRRQARVAPCRSPRRVSRCWNATRTSVRSRGDAPSRAPRVGLPEPARKALEGAQLLARLVPAAGARAVEGRSPAEAPLHEAHVRHLGARGGTSAAKIAQWIGCSEDVIRRHYAHAIPDHGDDVGFLDGGRWAKGGPKWAVTVGEERVSPRKDWRPGQDSNLRHPAPEAASSSLPFRHLRDSGAVWKPLWTAREWCYRPAWCDDTAWRLRVDVALNDSRDAPVELHHASW